MMIIPSKANFLQSQLLGDSLNIMSNHLSPTRRYRNRRRCHALRLRYLIATALGCAGQRRECRDPAQCDATSEENIALASSSVSAASQVDSETRCDDSAASFDIVYADCLASLCRIEVPCCTYFREWMNQEVPVTRGGRLRDIYSLPPLHMWPANISCGKLVINSCLQVANVCIASLNFLNSDMKRERCKPHKSLKPTAAQISVFDHICSQTVRFLCQLDEVATCGCAWNVAFLQLQGAARTSYEKIKGDCVDLPAVAATCEPCDLISDSLVHAVTNPDSLFPGNGVRDMAPLPTRPDERSEYVRLTG